MRFEFFKRGDICGTYKNPRGDKALTLSSSTPPPNNLYSLVLLPFTFHSFGFSSWCEMSIWCVMLSITEHVVQYKCNYQIYIE